MVNFKRSPAQGAPCARFLFAHGAGAGMDSDFMIAMTELLVARQIEVWRFNFPYMQIMTETGKRRPPDRMPMLVSEYLTLIEQQPSSIPLFIGGKSMGGRAATLCATAQSSSRKVSGVIALGYPFHPPAKPDKLRTEHLALLYCPCLIVQGDRDALGNQAEIESYQLAENIKLAYLPDGDHSFKPRKASGVSLEQNLTTAADLIADFIKGLV